MHDAQAPSTDSHQTPSDSDSGHVARRGRPVGNRLEKRGELLTAAIEVIAQEGYAGTSLRKVASHAGCTTGAVTYYFANKEEMITAAAQSLFDEFDNLLEPNQEQVDVRAMIEQWLNLTQANDSARWLALFQMLAHARHEPVFADVIQKRYSRFRQDLAVILAKGQTQGIIRKDVPSDLLADQLSALSDGWMMMLPIEPERFQPKRRKALMDAVITLISPSR
ncbi:MULTISPECIES: TetR/AcrR family transcriptional regulator [unclassified Pseudomonas]|uniref:TetR/AcrR family transcriptional regulator n=1 Tax=unclassified Pseudomonas TaxID=196821 RepID=UPI000CD2187B|nr:MULTISPECIES: TetR/AcrR family transcriptional regulator [unclassified Pseudomonas]POA35831.1 TetR family transcriptional regulator [Pseudomonas sp. GW456-R21]POA71588.1 TetR family transcriptional regulator [Pseudomonas sp. GW460-R15]